MNRLLLDILLTPYPRTNAMFGAYDRWKLEDGDDPGHGPVKKSLLHCTCCDWRGDFSGAVDHFQRFDHPLTYHGTVQDFSKYKVSPETLARECERRR